MLTFLVFACAALLAPPSSVSPDAETRLTRAETHLRELATRLEIPGIAYAIVVDGQLRTGAHGVRQAGGGGPMTVDTSVALGSGSEAFTSVLAAMLVEDGTVWWEEPVARLVPRFTLVDASAAAKCTIRDLLCHRTGLMRTDLAWLGDPPPRDIVAAFGGAKPTAPFRSLFQQESTGYVVLGLALAGSVGTTQRPITGDLPSPESWETLVRSRLLDPLAMKSTGLARGGDGGQAIGSVRAGDGSWRTIPVRATPNAAPAVGLRSNAMDLARWLQLLVGRGRIGDQRLVSIERMEELWRPELALNVAASSNIAGGAALGFDALAWKDHRLIRHDGGSQGLRVCTAVLPDDGAGWVLLANAAPSGLARRVESRLCPALLGEADDGGPTPEGRDVLDELVGRYRSAVLGSDLELRNVGGQLEVAVSDGGSYDLLPPDASGSRAVAGAPDVTFSFPRDADGALRRLVLMQSGMRFECPRVDAVPSPADPSLREYAGLYLDTGRGGNIAVVVAPSGRLALDVRPAATAAEAKRSLPLELERAGERDRWGFVGVPGAGVAFVRSADGRVTGFSMRASDGVHELARVGELSPEAAGYMPEMEPFLARHAHAQSLAAAGGAMATVHPPAELSGAIEFLHQGVGGTFTSQVDAAGASMSFDLGAYGNASIRCGGAGAGRIDAVFDGPRTLPPLEADRWRLVMSPVPPTAWLPASAFTPAGIDGPTERPGVRLLVRTPAGATAVLVIDATTFTARRLETEMDWGALGAGPILVSYDGWESSGGPAIATRLVWDSPVTGRVEIRAKR